MEHGAAFHLQRWARMVGEDEDRHMVWRIGAPPALPVMVRPRPAHRPEHVAAHDPGADILEGPCCEVVVDAGGPALSPLNAVLEGSSQHKPPVQLFAALTKLLLTGLVRPGTKAVGRDGKAVHAKLGHGHSLDGRCSGFSNRILHERERCLQMIPWSDAPGAPRRSTRRSTVGSRSSGGA